MIKESLRISELKIKYYKKLISHYTSSNSSNSSNDSKDTKYCMKENYEEDGREFCNFFYDVVFLVKALQDLPNRFHKLAKIKNDAYILMHNSVLANLALSYLHKGHQVVLEPERNSSYPDLKIDEIFVEVKTIVSPKENTPKSFEDFAYAVTTKIEDEAKEQVGDNGMIFIAPWSGIVNSLYYTYYYQMKVDSIHNNQECDVNTDLHVSKGGQTVIVIATPNTFQDYYLVFETKQISTNLNNFASAYYPIFNSPAHKMKYLSILKPIRNGFVCGTADTKEIFFKTG